jgi:hypothetical protein
MTTTTTVTITPAMRFGAHAFLQAHRGDAAYDAELRAVRGATYAESFPDSYTDEMVAASQRLIAEFPIEARTKVSWARVHEVLNAMQDGGRNAGLRIDYISKVKS